MALLLALLAACANKKSDEDRRPAIQPPPAPASVESELFPPSAEALLEAPVIGLLPSETVAVLVASDLRELHDHLGLDALGGPAADAFRVVAGNAIGRDVLDPDALEAAGLDLHRPGAVALVDGAVVIVWPLADARAFQGAWTGAVGVLVRDGHGLLVAPLDGTAPEARVERLRELAVEASLARTPRYLAAARALNYGPDAAVFVNLGALTAPVRDGLVARVAEAERASSAQAAAELELRLYDQLIAPMAGAAAGVGFSEGGVAQLQVSVSLASDRGGWSGLRAGADTTTPGAPGDRIGALTMSLTPAALLDLLAWMIGPMPAGPAGDGGTGAPDPLDVEVLAALLAGDVAVSVWPRPDQGWGTALSLHLVDPGAAGALLRGWAAAGRAAGLPVEFSGDRIRVSVRGVPWFVAVRDRHLIAATEERALVDSDLRALGRVDHDLAERLHQVRGAAGGLCIEAGVLAHLVEQVVARRVARAPYGVAGLGATAEASGPDVHRYLQLARKRAGLATDISKRRRDRRARLGLALGTSVAFARADGDTVTLYGAQFLGVEATGPLTQALVDLWYEHSVAHPAVGQLATMDLDLRRQYRALQAVSSTAGGPGPGPSADGLSSTGAHAP